MILQDLCDLYKRLEDKLPPPGFEEKTIPFIIVIDKNGKFIDLQDNREEIDGKLSPRSERVPKASGRSGAKSYETAYCLWDHYGYIAAQPKVDKLDKPPSQKDIDTAIKQHQAFKNKVEKLAASLPEDTGVQAVKQFLQTPDEIEALKRTDNWQECLKIKGCNLSFSLAGSGDLVCRSPSVINWVMQQPLAEDTQEGICLVTGEKTDIVRLHSAVSGVAQKPSPLAAINDSAYCSFGKDKGFNFPVGAEAAFKYATALNYMLRKSSPTKFKICDTIYACWGAKNNRLENDIPFFLSDISDNPEQGAESIKHLFNSLHNGAYTADDGKETFYVLGLAPNSARIVVRFWQVGSVGSFTEKLVQWFSDLNIEGRHYHGYPSLKKLLRATAFQYKDDNIPPNLSADMVRTILSGAPLPETMAQVTIRRIKAEQGNITYFRAALLKAWLNRKYRQSTNRGVITVTLNREDTRTAYNLGRLFAVLEKLQKDAQPGINATIRDRYYSSASCTPQTVFGTLIRLSNHHRKKLEQESWRIAVDKLIGEIMALINEFPAHLNLEDQSLFALGYYHQKNDLFKKTEQEEQP